MLGIIVFFSWLFAGCGGSSGSSPAVESESSLAPDQLQFESIAEGLASPVFLTAPPGDDRLFVVEQPGQIRIIKNGEVLPTPFLDIAPLVQSGGEEGILSIAFHPSFDTNGFFFVYYTDTNAQSRVERYTVSPNPERADRTSAALVISIRQPFNNHNGGLVTFGLDGMLYLGLGDGGGGGDKLGHSQDTTTLLGSLLRIDVDSSTPYAIPPDNPFAGAASARPEIWAYGLRNPWRYAFDADTGLLFIADVGGSEFEEISVVSATEAGLNFGWNILEGAHCYNSNSCSASGLVVPDLEYANPDEGCAVIGGFVYRGEAIPEIRGRYFYSDLCGGWLRSFRIEEGIIQDQIEWDIEPFGQPRSFGQDAKGELYMLTGQGSVLKLIKVD